MANGCWVVTVYSTLNIIFIQVLYIILLLNSYKPSDLPVYRNALWMKYLYKIMLMSDLPLSELTSDFYAFFH